MANNNNLYNLYGNNGSFFQNLSDYNTQVITNVDNETNGIGSSRINTLNENYLEKRNNYKKILITLLIACFIFFILICISRYTSFLSPTALNVLFIIIFLITTGYCLQILYDIYRRNNIYYERLNLNPPNELLSNSDNSVNKNSNNLLGSNLGKCVGENCCSSGVSFWDPGTMKCIPKILAGTSVAGNNADGTSYAATASSTLYLYTSSDVDNTKKGFNSSCDSATERCGYSCIKPGTSCALSPAETNGLPAPISP